MENAEGHAEAAGGQTVELGKMPCWGIEHELVEDDEVEEGGCGGNNEEEQGVEGGAAKEHEVEEAEEENEHKRELEQEDEGQGIPLFSVQWRRGTFKPV